MKNYTFKTREETVNFLDEHKFKYYIPRIEEYMSNIKDELKSYHIEVSDHNEVTNCYISSFTDGKEYKEKFFDTKKVDEFKDTAYNKDYREKKYEEVMENYNIMYKPGDANEHLKYKADIEKEYF